MEKKKRNAWLAGIMSLFAPGLGHVYVGDPKNGLLIVVGFICALLAGGAFGVYSTFYGILVFSVLALGFYVVLITSAVRRALVSKDYELSWYNRWYWYGLIFVSVTAAFQLLFAFRGPVLGYETYRIPAASMAPALRVGDFITVDTRYSRPVVGDVVVFRWPKDPKITYVKRIAALGGDSIAIAKGDVLVNGVVQRELSVSPEIRQHPFSISMAEQKVPDGRFFVLGDWRDNSNDSRFWGTVPLNHLVGKVTYIWLSNDLERIGTIVR